MVQNTAHVSHVGRLIRILTTVNSSSIHASSCRSLLICRAAVRVRRTVSLGEGRRPIRVRSRASRVGRFDLRGARSDSRVDHAVAHRVHVVARVAWLTIASVVIVARATVGCRGHVSGVMVVLLLAADEFARECLVLHNARR